MKNIEPVDNSTVDNDEASITEELAEFVDATTTALADTGVSEDHVDAVETVDTTVWSDDDE